MERYEALTEQCPGSTPWGKCHRRAAHSGHCATGGAFAQTLDELDQARQRLEGAVDALEQIASRDTLATQTIAGCRRAAREALASLNRPGGQ